jgi:putative flippase GtrA
VATLLARPLTDAGDPLAGFFALRRSDFLAAERQLNPVGYKIGLELLVKCGFRHVREVPIHFENRLHGESKLSLREQRDYLRHLIRLYQHRYPGWTRFARFCLVGLSGAAVDLALFALLLALTLRVPAASVLAIGVAMTWNFALNRRWTFADSRRQPLLRQYLAFCLSCCLGSAVNWSTRVLLWTHVPFFSEHALVAAAAGVATGTFFNFSLCQAFVFRPRGTLAPPQPLALAEESRIPSTQPPPHRRPLPVAGRLALALVGATFFLSGQTTRDAAISAGSAAVSAADKPVAAAGKEPPQIPAPDTADRPRLPAPGVVAGRHARRQIFDLAEEAVEQRLRESAEFLASDELEGRGVRTKGLDLAAGYIAEQYREIGLRDDHYAGTPFHEFRLYSTATNGSVQELTVRLPDGQSLSFQPKQDFSTLTLSVNGRFTLPLTFAGYGITAPELGYDDYAGIDVAGKAVILLRHEPRSHDSDSPFSGTESSDHALLRTKIDNAVKHGAALIILCTDVAALPAASEAAPAGMTTPSQEEELLDVELNESSLRGSIPVVHCRRPRVEALIRATAGAELADWERRIDETLQPHSRLLPECRVSGRVGLAKEGRTLRNVVASLEGEGPLAEETIVIGAHYDHLGRGGYGSLAIGANAEIHNGADDNASGTTVLIEVARQLASRPEPLRRRVLFIAFSAEELGLIGSRRYVQDPLVPLDKTLAMLNLDMVGRMRQDSVTIYGTGTAAEWPALIDRSAAAQQLTIARRSGGYGPSDHASFFEHGIPVLHFFTGFHPQYHRPDDDAARLNIPGMRKVAAMVRDITVDLAQADAPPTRTASQGAFDLSELVGDDDSLNLGFSSRGPRLGVVLEPAEGGGVTVTRLIRQTPAERQGIRPGDVLHAVAGQEVHNPGDVIEAIKPHKAGETIRIRLTRRSVELELEIRL